jgi:Glycosyl transferase family 2
MWYVCIRRGIKTTDALRAGMAKSGQSTEKAASVLCRALRAVGLTEPGLPRLIDAVACHDGRVRLFFGQGSRIAALAQDGAPGCVRPLELREISGGVMVVAEGHDARLALVDAGPLAFDAVPDETALFAGLNTALAFRIAETPAQVAVWLAYMADQQGLQAALIVNRVADPGFAATLSLALGPTDLRIVLLDIPLPLGKPGLGPENHIYLAPDAPGKDRLTPPAPDPWRAPLGEGVLYEALKWHFLATARAVLTLDISDIIPPGTPNAFDACQTARGGVIVLAGRRIYPWRVRPGRGAHFGDHICRPFDDSRGIGRWGVAPARAGLAGTWRMVRISYAKPAPDAIIPFWRAMAIRVPGFDSGELAPKSALVEDAALLALADLLGHDPVRAPVSETRAAPRAATLGGRTAIVTTMKNEGPFILEWLAYHRAIGVDDFLIYTNDCTDGTDTMLAMLQEKGIVQHRENPFRTMDLKPQHAALQAAEDEPVMQDCGWGICMDVDEFINIKIGDGTLASLYAAMGDANMISLTWRLFGNADVHHYQDRFLIDQFTACAPEIVRKPHQAWGFKTLFRNIDIYKKLGVHRPKGLKPDLWDQVRWLNGSGRPMPRAMFRNGWRSSLETYGYDWVQLNHYAVRSAESFLVKRDRGRVNHVDRDQGMNYWFRMNFNAETDMSIQRMIPQARAEFDRLMADADIAAAHHATVAAHRSKIADLRAQGTPAAFYAELTSARMQALCRLQAHFGSAVFAAGPEVIPPDLHLRPLPPDFFFTVAGDAPDAEGAA